MTTEHTKSSDTALGPGVTSEELAALAEEIRARDAELVALMEELQAIKSSTSWRITAPLRFVINALRGNPRA